MFPEVRMRRSRASAWMRDLVQEHRLGVHDLIWPTFVVEGTGVREAVPSMPGVYRFSCDVVVEEVKKAEDLGIPAVAVFPSIDPKFKTDDGQHATDSSNLVCRAVAAIKEATSNLGVICDVALDPFTTHGQDGVLRDGVVANDETLEVLGRQAVVQAEAGADIVAPSDMMDGRVGWIRDVLDEAGLDGVSILSYAAKYASGFYGPFRDAVGSKTGDKPTDKRTYQMNPANGREAWREVELDVGEGADMVMVKPGMPYLDVVSEISNRFEIPVLAYQVSGEYAMMRAAADRGWLDWETVVLESLLGFKRAGASAVLTYAARDVAKLI